MTTSNRQATQKQMNYLTALATKAGFNNHLGVYQYLTGNAMYAYSRTYPNQREASNLIGALLDGLTAPVEHVQEECEYELERWNEFVSDLKFQAERGYDEDVQETLSELEYMASEELPSKQAEFEKLAKQYNYQS